MTKIVVDCIKGTNVGGEVLLGISLVGGAEGYLIEDPVLEERRHEGLALAELYRRLQLGQLLLV